MRDPYEILGVSRTASEADIKKAGATKVTDLKATLPKVDFVSVHCPKAPETVNMFNTDTLGLIKP